MNSASQVKGYDIMLRNLQEVTQVRWDCYRTSSYTPTFLFTTKFALSEERAQEIARIVGDKLQHFAFSVESGKKGLVYVQFSHELTGRLALMQSSSPATDSAIPPSVCQKFNDIELLTRQIFLSVIDKDAKVENPDVRTIVEFDIKTPNRFDLKDRGTLCPTKTALKTASGEPFRVHANLLNLAGLQVICAQAPTPDCEKEYLKAAAQHTSLIVDLTNKTDRIEKGCQRYYPIEDKGPMNVREWPGLVLTYVREEKCHSGIKQLKLHEYHLVDGSKEKTIARLCYRGWPDHGAISLRDFEALLAAICKEQERRSEKVLFIQCRAGVGRSGTIATGLALLKLKQEGKLTRENFELLLQQLILSGREQRSYYFVQSVEQYALLHAFAWKLTEAAEPNQDK
jgi:protein tyrosine phosphatase